jgi:hypothetical protein
MKDSNKAGQRASVGCFDLVFLHESTPHVNSHLSEIIAFFSFTGGASVRERTPHKPTPSSLSLEKVGALEEPPLAAVGRGGELSAAQLAAA